jgi:hypothetical protein
MSFDPRDAPTPSSLPNKPPRLNLISEPVRAVSPVCLVGEDLSFAAPHLGEVWRSYILKLMFAWVVVVVVRIDKTARNP